VRLAVLFGSTAMGEDDAGSDVDLLVVLADDDTLTPLRVARSTAAARRQAPTGGGGARSPGAASSTSSPRCRQPASSSLPASRTWAASSTRTRSSDAATSPDPRERNRVAVIERMFEELVNWADELAERALAEARRLNLEGKQSGPPYGQLAKQGVISAPLADRLEEGKELRDLLQQAARHATGSSPMRSSASSHAPLTACSTAASAGCGTPGSSAPGSHLGCHPVAPAPASAGCRVHTYG